jgi:RNA polymerase-associated protein
MVLAEKGINVEVQFVEPNKMPEDLLDLNPYNSLPTLVDRDLVLYDSRVIMEYLDERFPHPPLMPVDPVSRAKSRLVRFRVEEDWYSLIPDLQSSGEKKSSNARKMLRDSLTASAEVFAIKPFFLSDEFSMADCYIAPLLWRLESYGVELPKEAAPVLDYAERIFARPGFQESLTEAERELRS